MTQHIKHMQSKKDIRTRIAQEKKQHTTEELHNLSSRLFSQLEAHPRFQLAKTVLLYHSLPDEVQTHAFIEKWHSQKVIVLPVVKGNELELRTYKGADQLQTGSFHIQEPLGTAFPSPASIDLAIIPGVSFDRKGNRLGRGKGYYDRLLNKLNAYKIGICFQFQLTEPGLPTEDSDIPMDEVWTENGNVASTGRQC